VTIMITLRPGVAEPQRDPLIQRLAKTAGISRIHAFDARSKSAAVRRIYYAEVADGADVESVRQQLAAAPEVEAAEVPAARRLPTTPE
jgi:hypothetical protein